MSKQVIGLTVLLVISIIGISYTKFESLKHEQIISDLKYDAQEMLREVNQLKSDLESKDEIISDLRDENIDLSSELISINSYTERYYINGILTETNRGMQEALQKCKSKVDDLEEELRRCRIQNY
jgi:predicted  nucleic acid-binding Zn-ribbon protein